jgi:hypothetical protein
VPKGLAGSADWDEPKRQYYKYWKALKDARMNSKKVAKVVYIKVPRCLVARVIKAVKKEKNLDWNFKAENSHDPWELHFETQLLEKRESEEHDLIVLTLWIDRRSDL